MQCHHALPVEGGSTTLPDGQQPWKSLLAPSVNSKIAVIVLCCAGNRYLLQAMFCNQK
jgi:hypothetical protein